MLGVPLHFYGEFAVEGAEVQISGTVIVHEECGIDGFDLRLRGSQQRRSDGVDPWSEGAF